MGFYAILGIVTTVLAVSIAWRYASRRWQIPCPSFLAFAVSGGPFDWYLGTNQTLDWMQIAPGERVLEMGPGPGRLLIPAAKRVLPGGQAVGLELQERMIARLRRRAEAQGVQNLRVLQGDAARPHGLKDFDLVCLSTVLGEIPDRQAALRNAFNTLRPGGRLSITEIIGDPHYQPRATVRRLAESVGFQYISTYGNWRRFTMNFQKPA